MTSCKIKSPTELLASGWGYNKTRGWYSLRTGWTMTSKHEAFLGQAVELEFVQFAPKRSGWVEPKTGLVFSRYALTGEPGNPKITARRSEPVPTVQKCTCDIRALWDSGCRCGGFASEQRRLAK